MELKKMPGRTPGRRHATGINYAKKITKKRPEKALIEPNRKSGGRNSTGRVTVRHRGGGHKRFYRKVDFTREKRGIPARVAAIEYDPNRSANIALLFYKDGEKRYILAPEGLKVGDWVEAGDKSEIKLGNMMPLSRIPVGLAIHNIEIVPLKGGQVVRSAGTFGLIQSKEDKVAVVKMPSGELRRFLLDCYATIGQISNVEWKSITLGKAGRKRHKGFRPAVRGVAQHPSSHPHGGGEGRSPIGMPSPKSPWGKKTLGKRTRKKKKYSDKWIVRRRR